MDFTSFTTLSFGLIIFGVFSFAFLVQLFYHLFIFFRLAFYKKKTLQHFSPPVSVIICARNEDDNLVNFLPKIFEQNYPEFEVVVVNDCSYDNSGDILKEFANKHNNLRIVTIHENENHSHGKKVALMMGIKGAIYEHLLLTDADCYPNSKEWIQSMVQHFTTDTEIVLGYGAYEKQKGFLNRLIRFDTFIIAMQYLSFALARRTYMGTGRNLSYRKSLFFQMKGFASHYHIESGDDDLFVNEAANKKNTSIEIAIESHTISQVKKTYRDWIRQKRRHVSTFSQYNVASKFRLLMLTASQYVFYLSFILLLLIQFQAIIVLSIFLIRYIIQFITFIKSMKLLNEKDLILIGALLEISMMIIYPIITFSNLFVKKNNWK
jgi:glycosyltransferase involved in cell wall biosynthesis